MRGRERTHEHPLQNVREGKEACKCRLIKEELGMSFALWAVIFDSNNVLEEDK